MEIMVSEKGPSRILINTVADWLMQVALDGSEIDQVVRGCCDRLAAAGLPITRVHLSFSLLHPLFRAMGFTWRRSGEFEVEGYRHVESGEADRFTKSPYYHLLINNLEYIRRRLDTGLPHEFPILDDLEKEGLTDYLAFVNEFRKDSGQGMLGSWSTDRPNGFNDGDIAALLRIQNRLAVAAKVALRDNLARSTLTTYLGRSAGGRVLDGQVRRGDGETTRAAIVMGDIRNSTSMAEKLGRQAYIDVLNTFFDHTAGAFAEHGGEILGFLGDGFLVAFPSGRNQADSKKACLEATHGARAAVARMKAANAKRKTAGEPGIGFGLGLHIGNVMFGNVGLPDRLSFSVFGSAVNEAARLESMTKQFKSPVVASQNFVDYCGGSWKQLGEECLRGVSKPVMIYSPKWKLTDADLGAGPVDEDQMKHAGLSDAENVLILHRDARKNKIRAHLGH